MRPKSEIYTLSETTSISTPFICGVHPPGLFFPFKVRRAWVITYKPQGIYWPPAQGGSVALRARFRALALLVSSPMFSKRTKRKIKQRLCTGYTVCDTSFFWLTDLTISSSLRPGTKGFTWGKWIIGYNFGTDGGTESKFVTRKELIVLNISKYEYCVNKSRDMPHNHFAKNCKLLLSWWPV